MLMTLIFHCSWENLYAFMNDKIKGKYMILVYFCLKIVRQNAHQKISLNGRILTIPRNNKNGIREKGECKKKKDGTNMLLLEV